MRFIRDEPFVVLDGAVGTELERRGCECKLPLWSAEALINNQELLFEIYNDYIESGAEILSTNTFRTTQYTLNKYDKDLDESLLIKISVDIIKEAQKYTRSEDNTYIAGIVAPIEDCYKPNDVPEIDVLLKEHRNRIEILLENDVDLIIAETIGTLKEAKAIMELMMELDIPFFISFICRGLNLLSEEPLSEAINLMSRFKVDGILTNCTSCKDIDEIMDYFKSSVSILYGGYANTGKMNPHVRGDYLYEMSPSQYSKHVKKWIDSGAKLVGGCCGTTPSHIECLKGLKDIT